MPIAAGVLALLGGLWHLTGVAGGVVMLARDGDLARAMIGLLLHASLAGLLLTGGFLLLIRKPAGRMLTITGAAAALVGYAAALAFGLSFVGGLSGVAPLRAALLVLCVPAIATLVLALVPQTARWVTYSSS